jgi:predicted Zn-dependent protease
MHSSFRHAHLRTLLLGVVAAVLFSGCVVQRSPITGNKRAYGYTWAQEIQIGRESDPAIIAQFGLYDDAQLSAYVTRIGEAVLAESHLRRPEADPQFRNTPFTFRVLDSPVVNAFALPGGYVYVTRGLLSHLNNEAQLAVVLGHEVTHVAARHASQRAATQQFGMIGLIGAALGGQAILGGSAGQNILDLGGTAAQLLFLRYGRDDERESDQNGVDYAGRVGYKTSEAAAFFHALKRISEQSGGGIPSFLSTHPDPGEREQTILRLAVPWEQAGATAVRQDAFYNNLGNLVLGEDPRQGFVEGGVFYHPELRFSFPVPPGYQVVNQPTQVGMVEPNQNAILLFTMADEATSARDAASKLTAEEGITTVDSGPATVSGNPAYYVLADAQTDNGEVRLLSYYIEYGGQVYTFLGYASKASFSNYRSTFERSMRGFDRVTDQRILSVQPTRLRVVTADRSGSFASFLPSNLPEQFTPESFAILNQVNLDTRIERGQKIKLPR